jgi:hypothetical protein
VHEFPETSSPRNVIWPENRSCGKIEIISVEYPKMGMLPEAGRAVRQRSRVQPGVVPLVGTGTPHPAKLSCVTPDPHPSGVDDHCSPMIGKAVNPGGGARARASVWLASINSGANVATTLSLRFSLVSSALPPESGYQKRAA